MDQAGRQTGGKGVLRTVRRYGYRWRTGKKRAFKNYRLWWAFWVSQQ